MKTGTTLLIAILFPAIMLAQVNLVLNPSFDDTFHCPSDSSIIKTNFWYNPVCGSPDLFHSSMTGNLSCADQSPAVWGGGGYTNTGGVQLPRTGEVYTGMYVTLGTELMAGKLSDSLISGKSYAVSFYTSLGEAFVNQGGQGLDLIGLCFMQDSITDYSVNCWQYLGTLTTDASSPNNVYLTDTSGWILVQDTFVAAGGEFYFVVGNIDTANTQYYNSTTPTTCYYYFDDFDVHCIDCTQDTSEPPAYDAFSLSPNPTSGQFVISGNFPPETQLVIYNTVGQKIAGVGNFPVGNNSISVHLQLAQGLYYYELRATEKLAEGKLLIVE